VSVEGDVMIVTSKREDLLALVQFQCANQSWLTLRAVMPDVGGALRRLMNTTSFTIHDNEVVMFAPLTRIDLHPKSREKEFRDATITA